MQVKILSIENAESGFKKLPSQFEEVVREDIIQRAIDVLQANKRQKYGSDTRAGKKHSTKLSRRRRKYRGSYGIGISRVPRKILSRRGTRMFWVGAMAPGTVGGRRAHPPKAEKEWELKINKKENKKAIRSAMAATINKELVEKRGHKIPASYPFIIQSNIENMGKTKAVRAVLEKLGFEDEIKRCSKKKIRAGKGKKRGRRYKTKKGPLLVVGEQCKLIKTAQNIAGVDVVPIKNINAELLAPGSQPGRMTVFTENAIHKLEKEGLFK